jgi:hypothetical protein
LQFLSSRIRNHLILQITKAEEEHIIHLDKQTKRMLLQHLSTCQNIGVLTYTKEEQPKFAHFNPQTSMASSSVTSLGLPGLK